MGDTNHHENASRLERVLDCWRRDLPADLRFDIDVDGCLLKNPSAGPAKDWNTFSQNQKLFIYLYFHAKVLIQLPILSKFGNHHYMGLSAKEDLELARAKRGSMVVSKT